MKTLLIAILFATQALVAKPKHEGHPDDPSSHTRPQKHEEHAHGEHAHGGHDHAAMRRNRGKIFLLPSDCGSEEVWDSVTAMCLPYPLGTPVTHLMLHGNIFGAAIAQTGLRGDDAVVSTQMLMANIGRTFGERHYLNLGLMVTGEKFTLPQAGYPLLLQTGDANRFGQPYLDHQHPHNTPIMGLTVSDTIRLGEGSDKSHLKLFFSPRGQSPDGPITFMHRPTGAIQPDAPLGHHIGQDVGHITSTVIGASLRLSDAQFEVATFNGTEPEPDEINLPLGGPNSFAARAIGYFSDRLMAMASVAYVKAPHPHSHGGASGPAVWDEGIRDLVRYSVSAYTRHRVLADWNLYHSLIYGSVRTFGVGTHRHSVGHELSLRNERSNLFTRTEILQRLPVELAIAGAPRPLEGRWVAAVTLGYSHVLADWDSVKLNLGGSITRSFLPDDFAPSYGGNPWTAKGFLQLSGMDMWMW